MAGKTIVPLTKGTKAMSHRLYGCTLDAADLARVTELYARSANIYQATVRYTGDRAHIHLRGDKAPIAALLDEMIAREGDCCAHIQFDTREADDGYDVVLSVRGAPGMERAVLLDSVPAFFPAAETLEGTQHESATAHIATIDRAELAARLERGEPLILVEVLPEKYYRKSHLPGAINIPIEVLRERAALLLPDRSVPIVVYCADLACRNSSLAATWLMANGYTEVYDYADGKQDWIAAGMPTERGLGLISRSH
jgi:rhodanese-related sulfurtransferase